MSDANALRARLFGKSEMFTIQEACQYIHDVVAVRATMGDKPFQKRFFEEFWPLVTIAKFAGSQDTRIEYPGPNEAIDATLIFGGIRQMVELTAAIDGQQEALRDEHLKLYRRAPVTAKIKATGKRNTKDRVIEDTPAEVWSSEQQQIDALARMTEALLRKTAKASSRPLYRGAWLGIVIPNFPPTDHKSARYNGPSTCLLKEPTAHAPFSRVFVVSTVGDYIFDSDSLR